MAVTACGTPDTGASAPTTARATTSPTAAVTTTTAAPVTTTAAPTTRATGARTTTATLDPATATAEWLPACTARTAAANPATSVADERRLDGFGPLRSEPTVTIGLPSTAAADSTGAGRLPPFTRTERIPGGVLLVLSSSSDGAVTTVAAAVNHDGSVRWVQCLPGSGAELFAAPASSLPRQALVTTAHHTTKQEPVTHELFGLSLADGSITTTHADTARSAGIRTATLADLRVFARGRTTILLGHSAYAGTLTGVDLLYALDLRTLAVGPVAIPDELRAAGRTIADETFVYGADDALLLTGPSPGSPVLAVLHGGSWVRTPDALAASRPPLVSFGTYDAGAPLQAVDASGAVLWTQAGLTSPGLQGVTVAVAGDTAVADVCTAVAASSCRGFATVAVDTATGKEQWRLDGFRQVSVVADGYALVTDGPVIAPDRSEVRPPGWMLLDLATGQPVAGQAWARADAFRWGCCGESDTVWVTALGGIVVATNGTAVSLWYPADSGGVRRTVVLD